MPVQLGTYQSPLELVNGHPRLSPSRSERWEDSCFHDKDGVLKTVVLQWLDSLTYGLLHPGPVEMLANVSRKALKREPKDRPKIEDICADLTFISLKAYLITVRELFHKYMENYTVKKMEQTSNRMKLWFESERLAAFAYVTGLESDKMISSSLGNLNTYYNEYLKAFKTMTVRFQEGESESFTAEPNAIRGPKNTIENYEHFRECLETDICELIESLWNLMPKNDQRKAEAAWLRAILDTKDVRRLDDMLSGFSNLRMIQFTKKVQL